MLQKISTFTTSAALEAKENLRSMAVFSVGDYQVAKYYCSVTKVTF